MSYSPRSALSQYQSVSGSSALYSDPHTLIRMLLDGALDRLAQAKGAIAREDRAAKGELLGKGIAIIGGLQGSLNHETGGEISQNLDSLYDYMQRRLLHANLHDDVAAIDEVAKLLGEIRSAWQAIPAEARTAPAATATTG